MLKERFLPVVVLCFVVLGGVTVQSCKKSDSPVPASQPETPDEPTPEPVENPQWMADTLSAAAVTLPSLFSDDMLLQRNATVKLWGTGASAGDTVRVWPSWSSAALEAVASDDGRWTADVATPDAGGPYIISIYNRGRSILNNVLIGDLWFCSGQSNMEMPLSGFSSARFPADYQADMEAASPDVPLRIFNAVIIDGAYKRQYAASPQEEVLGSWQLNTPGNVRYASCLAWYFARGLVQSQGVPVGIIISSRSGSGIQCWMSEEAATAFAEIDTGAARNMTMTDEDSKTVPCALYNAMVAPFLCLPIKGIIWYQGENNRNQYEQYAGYQDAFVADLRSKWGVGDFPFYFVQIAPYSYGNSSALSAARLRAAQARSAEEIPNCGMVCTMDLGEENNIHPLKKKEVSARLVNYALACTYGHSDVHYRSPQMLSVSMSLDSTETKSQIDSLASRDYGDISVSHVQGATAVIKVDAQSSLAGVGESVDGFEIEDDEGVWYKADATVTATDEITVRALVESYPVSVRYCYHNYVMATVFDVDGLPLLPFCYPDEL